MLQEMQNTIERAKQFGDLVEDEGDQAAYQDFLRRLASVMAVGAGGDLQDLSP